MAAFGGTITAEEGFDKIYHSGESPQPATPLAYGKVTSDGTWWGGTANIVSVAWNDASDRYEISIQDTNYFVRSYSAVITGVGNQPTIFRSNSVNGKLLVYAYNLNGTAVQSPFSFVVFGPF